ncbi:MAG TPA: hypothetical protein GX527_12165 [Clostridiaceae bacterium]|jgi:hypothetical protein|nr:hypothetical protein [Clostridiaceae bacterium]
MFKPRNSCGAILPTMQGQFAPYTAMPQYQSQSFQPTQPVPIPMPTLPTGVPTGPSYNGVTPAFQVPSVPPMPPVEQPPQSVQSPYYLAGFLRRHIGRMMRVEFLLGTTAPLVDRIGTLIDVGASYIVLRLVGTDDMVVCDLYSIKFVTIYKGLPENSRP